MSFYSKVAKDSFHLAPGILAQLIGGFLFSLLLGKLLSPEEFGRYSLFFLAQAYASTLVFGWLQNAIIRFVSANSSSVTVFHAFAWRYFAWVLLIGGGVWAVSFIFCPDDTLLIGLMLLLLVFASAYTVMQCFFRASFFNLHFSWHAFLLAMLKVAFVSALFLFVVEDDSELVLMVFIGLVVAHMLILLWQTFSYSRLRNEKESDEHEQSVIERGFKYGFPLAISLLLISFLQTGDRYLLAGTVTMTEVGMYAFWMGIGMQLGQGIYRVLFMALNPRLFQAHAITPDESFNRLYLLAWGYSLFFAPLCILAGSFVPMVILTLGISPGFEEGSWIAVFGMLSAFMLGFSQIVGKKSELDENTWLFITGAIVGGLVMVGGVVIMVPHIGLLGACLANIAGFLAYALVLGVGSKTLRFFIPACVGVAIGSLLGLIAFTLEIRGDLFLAIVISFFLYGTVVIFTLRLLKRK